jgi:hypothetical protein
MGSIPPPSALGSMVKWKSCLASNEMFQVQILVELLMEKYKRKGNPIGDGTRLEAGRAFSICLESSILSPSAQINLVRVV